MNILETIIDDIQSRNQNTWKHFNLERGLHETREKTAARIPIIPSLLQNNGHTNKTHKEKKHSDIFLIAEIKKASPSQGIICEHYNPTSIAGAYINNGVDAISVLTEEKMFLGGLNDLAAVRAITSSIPLLRKDFIINPYQVQEAYIYGADMVLLIVAALDDAMLCILADYIKSFGMTALVEVHNAEELERAIRLQVCSHPALIGINNRNLKTLEVSLDTSVALINHIPDELCAVSESGIFTTEDVHMLQSLGFSGILVGQSILKSENMQETISNLKQTKTVRAQ